MCFFVAGVAGFGPTNEGVKVPCLTAWLYPYIKFYVSFRIPLPKVAGYCYAGFNSCKAFYVVLIAWYISALRKIPLKRYADLRMRESKSASLNRLGFPYIKFMLVLESRYLK